MNILDPVPINEITSGDDNSQGPSAPLYKHFNSIIPVLQSLQKYSSYTFTAFSVMHGVAVIVGPSFSTDTAKDMMSMGRQLYQDSSLEWILVFGSLTTHVLSGMATRCLRSWMYRWKHGQRKAVRRNSQIEPDEEITDDAGLIGGLPTLAGLRPKRSFISRTLGLTPLQFAGYLSIPLVLYHVMQMRIIPLLLEGDSSYVSLDYVQAVLSWNQPIWRPLLNWVIYPTMVLLTTYHTVYGLLWWNNVKELRLRKLAMNVISLISLCGLWSLYMVHKMDSSIPGFVQSKFQGYLEAFYWF